MLLATINNSIGNINNHMTIQGLVDLFKKKRNYSNMEEYAIDMIQTEALPQEIEWFKDEYNISQTDIDYILSVKVYQPKN